MHRVAQDGVRLVFGVGFIGDDLRKADVCRVCAVRSEPQNAQKVL